MKKHLRLMLALFALTLGWTNASAQTDVTAQYITNAGFDNCTAETSDVAAKTKKDYSSEGWTNTNTGDFTTIAVTAYGGEVKVGGSSTPSTKKDGTTVSGNTLGIIAGWGDQVQIQSREITLPAGIYTLTVDHYLTSSTSNYGNNSSTFGFVTSDASYLVSSTEFTASTWTTETVTFTLTKSTTGKIQIGLKGNNITGSGSPAVFYDDITLEYIAWTEYSSTNTLDMTSWIVNPSFELNTFDGTQAEGSTSAGGGQRKKPTGYTCYFNVSGWEDCAANTTNPADGNYCMNAWFGGITEMKFYQTIDYLPEGIYEISAQVRTDQTETTGIYTYGLAGGTTFKSDPWDATKADATWNSMDNWQTLTARATIIGGGSLQFGLRSDKFVQFDDFHLTYLGTDLLLVELKSAFNTQKGTASELLDNSDYSNVVGVERKTLTTKENVTPDETVAAWTNAVNELQAAIDAFIAAKPTYDALVAEIAKAKALGIDETTADGYAATSTSTAADALASTQNLKVAEYNYVEDNYKYGVELGEWTSTGTNTEAATFNNEHWSGKTHDYKNQKDDWGNPKQGYAASSWSINFSQDVALPAGNYVFKVAGRQASGDKVTTSLVVKKGDAELGSVNDFPRGNKARGIDTSGATNFSDGGEYANNGNGYGWEWRYVKFTLEEEATVNIAINSEATDYNQWVSFGDYTVQTDDEANIALITYNVALNNAQTIIANSDYANVTGEEKTALQNAINADETLDKTNKADIEAATTTLNDAVATFTAAKAAYDAFVDAKTAKTPELEYAAARKKEALTTAKAAADATTATDAETKTAAITTALRKYVESHALAEGVTGATPIAVPDYRFEGMTNDDIHADTWKIGDNWNLEGQNNGSISFNTENSLTDGDGNADYNYIRIQKSDNNAGIFQEMELEPGKYMMTVAARCENNGAKFEAHANNVWVDIPMMNNADGQFGKGWNDVSVEFLVTATSSVKFGVKSNWGKNIWWTATRFRLVKFPTEKVTLDDAATEAPAKAYADVTYERALLSGWNSLVLPFEVTQEELGIDNTKEGERVLAYDGTTKNGDNDYTINFNDVTGNLAANTPYLIKKAADGENMSFTGKVIDAASTLEVADANNAYTFVGTYVAKAAEDNFIKAGDLTVGASALKKVKAPKAIKAFRAFLRTKLTEEEANNARISVNINGNEVDAIEAIEMINAMTDGIYNLQGQKVNAAQKGIYIVNGKKIVVR